MESYSKRLLELVETKVGVVKPLASKWDFSTGGDVNWWGKLDSLGKIEHLGFEEGSFGPVFQANLASITKILQGQRRHRLIELERRELENYLRDDNTREAFPAADMNWSQLTAALNNLSQEWLKELLSQAELPATHSEGWSEVPYTKRIRVIQEILDSIIEPLLKDEMGRIELVDIVDDEVVLNFLSVKNQLFIPSYEGALAAFFRKIFNREEIFLSLE